MMITLIIENLRSLFGIGFLLLTAIAVIIRIRLCNEIGTITEAEKDGNIDFIKIDGAGKPPDLSVGMRRAP